MLFTYGLINTLIETLCVERCESFNVLYQRIPGNEATFYIIFNLQVVTHILTAENIEVAFKKSRPSLSSTEQNRLMRIYEKFQGGRTSGMNVEEDQSSLKFDPLKKKKQVLRATLG